MSHYNYRNTHCEEDDCSWMNMFVLKDDLDKYKCNHKCNHQCNHVVPAPRLLGSPHWDNVDDGLPNRVSSDADGSIVYNVSSSDNETYPFTAIVFNGIVPLETPITSIESLTVQLANLKNTPSIVHIRLEVARQLHQGFANYVTLVNLINLQPNERRIVDLAMSDGWQPMRDLLLPDGTVAPGFEQFTEHTLTDLAQVLALEEAFNYPINVVGSQSYPGIVTENNPIPSVVWSFNIGVADSSSPTVPQHTYFKLTTIGVKLVGVQRMLTKVSITP